MYRLGEGSPSGDGLPGGVRDGRPGWHLLSSAPVYYTPHTACAAALLVGDRSQIQTLAGEQESICDGNRM